MYHGDIRLGDTIDIKFTTRAFSTGAPTTLAGTPSVAAYPGNSTTEITAGITLSVDFDSRTGCHNIRVVATSGNGYATATNYTLVITAGTVGGTSVVGECVGSFSIENRSALMPTTAAQTLDVSAGGEAGVDWANVGSPTTTVNLSGTTVKTATDVETDTADIQSRIPAALGANGNIKADVRDYSGTAGTFSGGRPEVNVSHWKGNAAAATNSNGYPVVDLVKIIGTSLSESPGTGNIAARFSGLFDTGSANGFTAATALSTLTQANIRSAVGLASANLDTQLSTIDDFLDTEIAAIKAKTDNLPASPAATGDAMTLTSAYDAAKTAAQAGDAMTLTAAYDAAKTAAQAGDAMTLTGAYDFAKGTAAMTESYAANGVAPTPVQAILGIHQMLMQFGISGTSYTVKKLDNATTAFGVTLDDATSPSAAART